MGMEIEVKLHHDEDNVYLSYSDSGTVSFQHQTKVEDCNQSVDDDNMYCYHRMRGVNMDYIKQLQATLATFIKAVEHKTEA